MWCWPFVNSKPGAEYAGPQFLEFLESLFIQKTKTLVNNLFNSKYGFSKEQIKNVLTTMQIKENVRSEELDLEKIVKLYNLLMASWYEI